MWDQPRRLYVAEFKNGVTKIGISQRKARTEGLRLRGARPLRCHFGELHQCGYWAERELLDRMRRIACTYKGREWFVNVSFGSAATLVDQISRRAVAMSPQPA